MIMSCRSTWVGVRGRLYVTLRGMTRVVHILYVVEQDEDGAWCASASLRPGVSAFGEGPTREGAIADLRAALETLIEEVGPPDELTLTLDID